MVTFLLRLCIIFQIDLLTSFNCTEIQLLLIWLLKFRFFKDLWDLNQDASSFAILILQIVTSVVDKAKQIFYRIENLQYNYKQLSLFLGNSEAKLVDLRSKVVLLYLSRWQQFYCRNPLRFFTLFLVSKIELLEYWK